MTGQVIESAGEVERQVTLYLVTGLMKRCGRIGDRRRDGGIDGGVGEGGGMKDAERSDLLLRAWVARAARR